MEQIASKLLHFFGVAGFILAMMAVFMERLAIISGSLMVFVSLYQYSVYNIPRKVGIRPLHGIEAFEFDTSIRGTELPVHCASLLIAMVLAALDLVTHVQSR